MLDKENGLFLDERDLPSWLEAQFDKKNVPDEKAEKEKQGREKIEEDEGLLF